MDIEQNEVENNFIKPSLNFIQKTFENIISDINYSYPNEELDDDNAHVSFMNILTTLNNINSFIDIFNNQYADYVSKIDSTEFLIKNYKKLIYNIDYSYPNEELDDDRAHISLEMLSGKIDTLLNILKEADIIEIKFLNFLEKKIATAYDENLNLKDELVHDILMSLYEDLTTKVEILSIIKNKENSDKETTNLLDDSSSIFLKKLKSFK
jgi:hypothetical protein